MDTVRRVSSGVVALGLVGISRKGSVYRIVVYLFTWG